jgi:hypothetical protein
MSDPVKEFERALAVQRTSRVASNPWDARAAAEDDYYSKARKADRLQGMLEDALDLAEELNASFNGMSPDWADGHAASLKAGAGHMVTTLKSMQKSAAGMSAFLKKIGS